MINGGSLLGGKMAGLLTLLSRIIIKGVPIVRPGNPFHPGEILEEEFLNPMGISQRAFAERLGWTPAKLNEILKGKRGITAETAIDLSKALRTSPEIWMNFQTQWDLAQAFKKRSA